ncbi:MAG: V-type ATPase 116kDa subunit family protein [Clostridia bacterium]|nr:V-type ATPase 116kDa subunit family protein [Clostridia bacterium]
MAVEKMKLMKLSGSLEQLSALCEKICALSCFEADSASKYISASMGFAPFVEENPYANVLASLREIAKSAGFALELCTDGADSAFAGVDDKYVASVQKKVSDLYAEKNALLEQKAACEAGIEKYAHFKGMEVDLDQLTQCEFVKARFGHLPKESYKKLQTVFRDNPYAFFYPCSEDKTEYWGVYFAPADMVNEIDGIFAFLLFEPFEVPGAAGTVDEVVEEFQHSIEIITSQLADCDAQLKSLWDAEKDRCNHIYTYLVHQNAVYGLRSFALHNDKYFMLVGYVPASDEARFCEAVQSLGGEITLETETPPEDGKITVPVKMKSGFRPFRFLVEPYKYYVDMYGTPAYSDIDITPFVAITYTILFGMMFGDLGQGAVLALVGFLMWKLKKMELGKILIPCGIASMCFGFLFGSVFGYEEMLDPVYHALGWRGKPMSVMDSINTVLLIAIAIGVGLMVAAMLLNIYACVKRKKFGEALFSQNGVVGLLLYLAGCNLASGFMGGPAPLPNSVAGIILGVCAVLLMFKEIPIGIIDKHPDWKPESVMDFVLQNLFELLEYILSYLSNTVSFLRVGAFVLVHAGMMMVVFSLAGESENLFVIILGNILVIALEGLLTGIQALRLEYYEMFSRFYEGGGKAFAPATLNEIQTNS